MKRRVSPDLIALLVLIALWLLFFWRLFTPITADQASLEQGDFSGQFVTFATYQYDRWTAGEVPLWNPYNNGGLPFIADTQAAVFYPPRLATIALAHATGGWSAHALELEMTVHVLAFTLFMYALVRRLTFRQSGSIFGAFIAALIAGYSGFTTGYAPLQLALLEAAIWLPLAALGIWEGTKQRFRPGWLMISGVALGLSWLAGHPQTSFFITYFLIALLGYRVYTARLSWRAFIAGGLLFGVIGFGLAAVQLFPGLEYLTLTTRSGFGYDAKANGFPFQDVIQFVFPGIVSLFSPLYVGFVGLTLALIAVYRKLPGAIFWGGTALFALIWSFGGNSALYPLLYNVVPGLRFFRGQERAAFLVMHSLAVLAGLGAAHLLDWDVVRDYAAALRIRIWLNRVFIACLLIGMLVMIAWIGNQGAMGSVVSAIALAVIVVSVTYLLLPNLLTMQNRARAVWSLAVLLAFELFTVNMDSPATYESIPADQQVSMTPPPLVAQVLGDPTPAFRVDGTRGLMANYGSLYGVQDIRGISPLFLNRAWAYIGGDLPVERVWEVFAVRDVFTDWNELPVASTIIGTGSDALGAINLHQLSDPRPFAAVLYRTYIEPNDESAVNLLRDTGIDPRRLAILNRDPGITSNDDAPLFTPAEVTQFAPEQIVIEADAVADGVLTVSLIDYPGWRATVDDHPTEILRAYAVMSAVAIPVGAHTITFTFDPLPYRIGAIVSAAVLGGVLIASIGLYANRKRTATVGRGD
ncbi:MAG: YfhO family protein [Anaerolineae bacterium]